MQGLSEKFEGSIFPKNIGKGGGGEKNVPDI
jgi:hypothetical protein